MPAQGRSMGALLSEVKALAVEYHQLTGKPLGVTGEVAEHVAASLFDLELATARSAGFDAIRRASGQKVQIKGRWKRGGKKWGRVPSIDVSKEFDCVMLVLMHGVYEPFEIWEAPRDKVISRLTAPGSAARNERGSMDVSQFKSIAVCVWRQPQEGKS